MARREAGFPDSIAVGCGVCQVNVIGIDIEVLLSNVGRLS